MALGARQQVKIWKTGQLSRHYIAEISLNMTLNHNQPTNQPTNLVPLDFDTEWRIGTSSEFILYQYDFLIQEIDTLISGNNIYWYQRKLIL